MKPITRREMLRLSVTAMGASLLAACTPAAPTAAPATQAPSGGATAAPQATAIPTVPTATAAPAQPVNLQYYIGYGSGGEPEKVTAVKKMFDAFALANPGLTAEAVVVPSANNQAKTKLQAMIAAGTPPDVLTMGMAGWDMAIRGAFVDMNTLLDADKVDTTQWDKEAFDSYTVAPRKNLLYGLPFGLNSYILVYNKTLWDAAGATMAKSWDDPSWTWDVLLEGAKKVTRGSGGNIDTFGMTAFQTDETTSWMFGGNYISSDLQRVVFDEPASLQGFEFSAAEIFTRHVAPTPAEAQALTNGFLSGKVGISLDGTWGIGTLLQIKDFEWDLAPMPFGGSMTVDQGRACPYWPDSLGITSKEHIQEAWKLVKFLLLDDANYVTFTTFMSMIPARKQFRDAFYKAWADQNPKMNWDIVKNEWKWTRLSDFLLNASWLEAENTFRQGIAPVWTGDAKAADVLPDLAKKVDAVWQQGVQFAQEVANS